MDQISEQNQYWASVPSVEIADNILQKVDDYYKYVSLSGRLDLWRRSHLYYYRPRVTGGYLQATGGQGELTAFSVNHYRNLLLHLETMTTQQKVAFQPRASNSDVKSQAQCILADSLLTYYMGEKRLDRNTKLSVKEALIYAEGFVRVEWDATSGRIHGKTDTGATIYEGDLKFTNYSPFDTIRDFTKMGAGQEDFYILRNFQNKYTLAAKFPALSEEILSDSLDALKIQATTSANFALLEDSDNVVVYTLLHAQTPALKQGRFTTILENGTVMQDGPLPYDNPHVYRIAPDEELGSIFGFTVGFDLLTMQEAIDILYSTAITNQSTFGVQNVLVPKGSDLSVSQIAGGMNMMEYDQKLGKPEALQLTATPPEIFNFMQTIEKLMETISGVNSVARGNPEASLKSGAALALVQSMAIQFSMSLQRSYAQLIEDIGTASINILKTYAAVPRVAAIVGKSNRPLMKEFKGDDLSLINRVTVDMGNPLTNTTAGKVNIAEQMMQMNMIENPDQYMQVITTGRLEPVIEGKQAQLLLIKGENEMLSEGIPQRVLITDNHQKHILEHSIIMANPEIRQDPNNPVIKVTLEHMQEHMTMANDPMVQQMMQVLHQEPIPPLAPQQPGAIGGMMNPAQPVVQQAEGVNQPNMPQPPQGTDANSAQVIAEQPQPQQAQV